MEFCSWSFVVGVSASSGASAKARQFARAAQCFGKPRVSALAPLARQHQLGLLLPAGAESERARDEAEEVEQRAHGLRRGGTSRGVRDRFGW